jgi:hypothetical protein
MALSEAASEAAGMAQQTAMCEAGDGVACRILSEVIRRRMNNNNENIITSNFERLVLGCIDADFCK